MKNYIKLSTILMTAAFAGLTTSCDLDAPAQSSLDGSTVFSTYSLAEAEIMSINVAFGETNSYRGRFLPFYGISTDVETSSGSVPSATNMVDDKQSLYNWNTVFDNGQMNNSNDSYAMFYTGIERANLAIEGIRQYGDIENNPDMAQLLGEALTLRAVLYSDLIKGWGDVPARFVPNNSDNVYLPRANKDSIYIQLLADLKEASDYCYWPNENGITKTTERVSKAFVKGLRARIALSAGGFALRGDGYRKSNDPALSSDAMYQIAKEECEDIINAGYNTLGDFKSNFDKLCKDNVTAGGESLWEIPFSDGRGRVAYTFAVKHNAVDQYTAQAQGGVVGPTPTLFYDYSVNDVRRDITCVPYDWSKDLVDGKSYQQLRAVNKWCFGKLRYEWMSRIVTSTNDDGINWQYMRLADVYLMAAEAENALGNTAGAWTYMEPVLARALPADEVAALKTKYTASKDAFFNGIVEQRGFEFAGESLRKQDLIRWGIVDAHMANEKTKLAQLANREGAYADLPEKVYYKLGADGESLMIYGLNHGETDEVGTELMSNEGYSSKGWFISDGTPVITPDYYNGLIIDKPSEHSVWPIWRFFIDGSNGMLNNDGNLGQL